MMAAERHELQRHARGLAKGLAHLAERHRTLAYRLDLLVLEALALEGRPDPELLPARFLHLHLALKQLGSHLTSGWYAWDAARRTASLATRVGKPPEAP